MAPNPNHTLAFVSQTEPYRRVGYVSHPEPYRWIRILTRTLPLGPSLDPNLTLRFVSRLELKTFFY